MKIVPNDLACTWVHSTQQKIGEVFRDAGRKVPTPLFYDEFDAMIPKRSGDEANQHYDNEVNEFLCRLNNASDRSIYFIAATNYPERIDKAVLRTGRIYEMIYDMPDLEARKIFFSLTLSKLPSDTDIDIGRLAELTKAIIAAISTFSNRRQERCSMRPSKKAAVCIGPSVRPCWKRSSPREVRP